MAKPLRDKVTGALQKAVGGDAHASIQLDDVPGDKVGGLVLSNVFANLTPSQRQDHIWKFLDADLSPFERTRVVFIVTDTPEEYEALRTAATG